MFGFSFSELVVLVVVAVVVIGPKDLPKVLRRVGQWAGKMRRMAADLRAQSGIDDVLRTEGLQESIQEIRKLTRGELTDIDKKVRRWDGSEARLEAAAIETQTLRDREYPRDGADAYGSLPDNALVYEEGLPKSDLAKDALYVMGDKDAIIPEPPPPPPEEEEIAEPPPAAEASPAEDGAIASGATATSLTEVADVAEVAHASEANEAAEAAAHESLASATVSTKESA